MQRTIKNKRTVNHRQPHRTGDRRAPSTLPWLGYGAACLLGCTLFSMVANAQPAANIDDLFDLDLQELADIEVSTATLKPQKVSEAPSIISVFRRKDIAGMAATSLIDVLKYAPSIEIAMLPNGHYQLAMRGERKDGLVLLQINGVTLNDPYNGQALFDLPAALVDRIEIIRGPGSALYGTNAVVGVISLFTRQGTEQLQAHVGEHKRAGLFLHQSPELRDGSLDITLGAQTDDGANRTVESLGGVTVPSRRGDTNRWVRDGVLSATHRHADITTDVLALYREQGPWTGPGFDLGPDTQIQQAHLSLQSRLSYRWSDNIRFKPRLYGKLNWRKNLNQDHPDGFTANLDDNFPQGALTRETYQAMLLGTDWQWDWQLSESVDWVTGLVLEYQKMLNYDLERNYAVTGLIPQNTFANHDQVPLIQDGKSRDVLAIYTQGNLHWQAWQLTLGLRYDHYSDFGDSLNPRLGIVYPLRDDLVFKALYAHAFRAPTFRELHDNTSIGNQGVRGNPGLDAETIRTSEVGLEWQHRRLVLRANLFYQEIHDQIAVYDPNGSGGRGNMMNTGNVFSAGVELDLTWQLHRDWTLLMTASQQRSRFTWASGDTFAADLDYLRTQGNRELVHTPRLLVNTGLRFQSERWHAWLGVRYSGRSGANNRTVLEGFRGFRGDGMDIPDRWQADASLSYQWSKHSELQLSATNLGATKYSAPDESNDIVAFGATGLSQPGSTVQLIWRQEL